MANTVEIKELFDGTRKLELAVHIHSDGVSGDLTNEVLALPSSYDCSKFAILRIQAAFVGFTGELEFNGSTAVNICDLPDYDVDIDFNGKSGGLVDSATGGTNAIQFTTTGFTAATDHGVIILSLRKIV